MINIYFKDETKSSENIIQIGKVEGTQDDWDNAWPLIRMYIKSVLNIDKPPYFRSWKSNGARIIDYGSHSKFFILK